MKGREELKEDFLGYGKVSIKNICKWQRSVNFYILNISLFGVVF